MTKFLSAGMFNLAPLTGEATRAYYINNITVFNGPYKGNYVNCPESTDLHEIEAFGINGKIPSSNFRRIRDPQTCFQITNAKTNSINDARLFVYVNGDYFALAPTGPIIPFICNIGIIGRCSNCSSRMDFTNDPETQCRKCKLKMCLCCGINNCPKDKGSKEANDVTLSQFLGNRQNVKITFLSKDFNLPFELKSYCDLRDIFWNNKNFVNLCRIKVPYAILDEKKWCELTEEKKFEWAKRVKMIEIFGLYLSQFSGFPLKFIETKICNEITTFIKKHQINHSGQSTTAASAATAPSYTILPITTIATTAQPRVPIPVAFPRLPIPVAQPRVPIPVAQPKVPIPVAQPKAPTPVVFSNGVDALLFAAQKLEDEEPPAKKTLVRELKIKDGVKCETIRPPILITARTAAEIQIKTATHFSKLPGMPPFVYPTCVITNNSAQAEMYREQLTRANAYIDMAIQLVGETK
jgi:hypothetical protein